MADYDADRQVPVRLCDGDKPAMGKVYDRMFLMCGSKSVTRHDVGGTANVGRTARPAGQRGGTCGYKCFVFSPVFSHVLSHVYSERSKHVLTQRVHSRLPVFSF